uniref:Uncharacterized protein n=1 Tax=Sphaerodactylus townsendi TaxID=933632 RepID=A0ACB8FJX0_9SAUR
MGRALLKVELGGPFVADVVDRRPDEFILVQIGQVEDSGTKRRRQQQILYNWTLSLNSRKSEQIIMSRTFEILNSKENSMSVQAFLQESEIVPLSMTYRYLRANVETQVTIASGILAGVYVLIIFELLIKGHRNPELYLVP